MDKNVNDKNKEGRIGVIGTAIYLIKWEEYTYVSD